MLHSGDRDTTKEAVEQKLAELEQELERNDKALTALQTVLKTEQREGSNVLYWLLLLVLYVVFCRMLDS